MTGARPFDQSQEDKLLNAARSGHASFIELLDRLPWYPKHMSEENRLYLGNVLRAAGEEGASAGLLIAALDMANAKGATPRDLADILSDPRDENATIFSHLILSIRSQVLHHLREISPGSFDIMLSRLPTNMKVTADVGDLASSRG